MRRFQLARREPGRLHAADGTFLRDVSYVIVKNEGLYTPGDVGEEARMLQLQLGDGRWLWIRNQTRFLEPDGASAVLFAVEPRTGGAKRETGTVTIHPREDAHGGWLVATCGARFDAPDHDAMVNVLKRRTVPPPIRLVIDVRRYRGPIAKVAAAVLDLHDSDQAQTRHARIAFLIATGESERAAEAARTSLETLHVNFVVAVFHDEATARQWLVELDAAR